MITTEEVYSYLKKDISDTSDLSLIRSFIEASSKEIDGFCNRNFILTEQTDVIFGNPAHNVIYVRNMPIESVESIQYFTGTAFVDLAVDLQTHIQLDKEIGAIRLYGLGSVKDQIIKVVYNAGFKWKQGQGSINGDIGGVIIEGTETMFTESVYEGDSIIVNGISRIVATITDDTAITLTEALPEDVINAGYVVSNMPENIRNVALRLCAYKYLESPQGENFLHRSSGNISLNSGVADVYKNLELSKMLQQYKLIPV